ncbi:MAG: MFS transporter [Candidatus Odinarchaeota archaeon]
MTMGMLIQKIMIVKFLRIFGSSLMSIIMPLYMLAQGYNVTFVGIVVSLMILSNIPFNILLTLVIKRLGQRLILVLLSALMIISALLFLWNLSMFMIIIAALIGLLSAHGTETGSFQSIEQSIISETVDDKKRTRMFSVYNFIGYVSMSFGSLLSGLPDYLPRLTLSFAFYAYAIIGLIQLVIYLSFTNIDEIFDRSDKMILHPKSRKTVLKLSALFSIDAFGGGFIVKTLLTTWFFLRFNVQLISLSLIFSIADVITAISIFFAPILAKRIGLLKTMVITHIPSNIFLILVPFAPTLLFAVIFLFLRQSISQMDVPTRQSYVNAIINAEDRASTAAITNTVRTVSSSISPPLATSLIELGNFVLPLVFGGGIKIVYDIAVYFAFRKIKPPEEKEKKS